MRYRYPKALLKAIQQVRSLRPRRVLDHILEHGGVTTQELRDQYGYNHPPRAAQDVKESGIPLKKEMVRGIDGRKIARYSIDIDEFARRGAGASRGRRLTPAALKRELLELQGPRCEICLTMFAGGRQLQVDHRIPYAIGGDPAATARDIFMLACPPCNRTKSWQCEHCENWTTRDPGVCRGCFWANPGDYSHVATLPLKLVTLSFAGEEELMLVKRLLADAARDGAPLAELIKRRLRNGGGLQ